MVLCLVLSLSEDPPSGGVSPLAWAIIVALATAFAAAVPALWYDRRRMYDDLKACNAAKAEQDEEILGLLKVLRVQMEQSMRGKKK